MAQGIQGDLSFPSQVLLIVFFSALLIYIQRKRELSITGYLIAVSFCVYLVKLLSVTFFPFDINFTEEAKQLSQAIQIKPNFIPFKSILTNIQSRTSWMQNGGNFILLLPFGVYLPLIVKRSISFKMVFLAGFLFSLSIELAQGIMNLIIGYTYRIVDVDDIILNTIGCIVGYSMIRLFLFIVMNSTFAAYIRQVSLNVAGQTRNPLLELILNEF